MKINHKINTKQRQLNHKKRQLCVSILVALTLVAGRQFWCGLRWTCENQNYLLILDYLFILIGGVSIACVFFIALFLYLTTGSFLGNGFLIKDQIPKLEGEVEGKNEKSCPYYKKNIIELARLKRIENHQNFLVRYFRFYKGSLKLVKNGEMFRYGIGCFGLLKCLTYFNETCSIYIHFF